MINTKNIPEYLKQNAKWCTWKYENRDGRQTKVPYNPKTQNLRLSINRTPLHILILLYLFSVSMTDWVFVWMAELLQQTQTTALKTENYSFGRKKLCRTFLIHTLNLAQAVQYFSLSFYHLTDMFTTKRSTTSKKTVWKFMYPGVRI